MSATQIEKFVPHANLCTMKMQILCLFQCFFNTFQYRTFKFELFRILSFQRS